MHRLSHSTITKILLSFLCIALVWTVGMFFFSPYPQKGPPFISGVVTKIDDRTLTLRLKNNKEITVSINESTQFRQGKQLVAAVHVGDGVVIAAEPVGDYPIAKVVRVISDVRP